MAEEKKTGKLSKVLDFFKNLPQRIATPFKNMWHELKKVTWPTRQDLIKYTCIVLLFMVFMGVVIGLLDTGASKLVAVISGLKSTDAETAVVEETADEVTEPAEDAAVEDEAPAEEPAAEETAQEAPAEEAAAEGETAAE